MKSALDILRRDLVALVKNPIALLVVGALLVLPGLYAWYCIVANWDPYSNTGNAPIAVVNRDRGAESDLAGEVDIGAQVVEKLEGNESVDWKFYDDEEEALRDTRRGLVYATIVLPEDLSESMLGIFEGSSDAPTVYYYPNEKYNAVATKVADSAAQTLIRQINQGFSSTVNEKVLEETQRVVDGVEKRADRSNKSAIAEIREIRADIDKVIASLDDAASSIEGWRAAAGGAGTALAAMSGQLPTVRSALSNGSGQLGSLRTATGDFESELSAAILESASTVSSLSANMASTLAQATEDLQALNTSLAALEAAAEGDADLQGSVQTLEAVESVVEGLVGGVNTRVSEIDATAQDAANDVKRATSRIAGEAMPKLSSGIYDLATSLSLLSGAIGQLEPQASSLQGVLSQTDSALDDAAAAIADAKSLLSTVGSNLKGTVADIGAIGKAVQIEQLSDLLDIDSESLGTFISAPVQMRTEEIFPVSNYGTAVAPFYTNLALWIGCFILVSLIKVEVAGEGRRRATSRERYFGRWMLFVILSLLQSQVICGVDIALGIDCANPALFMLAGAVCSFAYMNLIYALVKTFRNIGKTLCIFLLIMQVPGSSGMYPIEMMPDFFRLVHPALPFTYGIDAMREALSGMHELSYFGDVCVMAAVVLVSLGVGLGLRPAMANLLALFDEEMEKAGFFASEEYQGGESSRLRGMMRALAAHASYSDDIEERAWKFNRIYPKLRRAGSVATFAIPLVFLVLVFPFNATIGVDIDTKLTSLIIVLVLLLVVLLGLIVLEYMHRSIAEETRLLGASLLGDFDLDDLGGPATGAAVEGGGGDDAAGTVPAAAGKHVRASRGGPARDIFATDLKLGFGSVVGVVVIMLLVITPSLYAWFNIAGSWDPYGATGNLKVAVANEDEGYKGELVPVTINVGSTVVLQLRGNTSFDWVFVDKADAIAGVEGGEYYAAIEIPGDFSANMMTYLTDDASYPEVVYYTNEKENPIAPIITQKGADSIQENIRVSFTGRVDQVVLSVAYDLLNYLTNPNLSGYVAKMSAHLDDATDDARSGARELRALSSLAGTVASIVDATGSAIDGLEDAATAKGAVSDAKTGASQASSAIDEAVAAVREALDGRKVDVNRIQAIVDAALTLLESGAKDVPGLVQGVIDEMGELRKQATTDEQKAKIDAVVKTLEEAKGHADVIPGDVAEARTDADGFIESAVSDVSKVKTYLNDTVAPSVDDLRSSAATASSSASEIVGGLEDAVRGIGDSTGGLSSQLSMLSGNLGRAGDKLETAATSLEATKRRVAEALNSGDVQQVKDVVLGTDPEVLAASLAAPVQQSRQPVYSVGNYGSAMAPFYTVLSLWVGALVMISTMRVHVVEERIEELRRKYGKVRPRHEFFGRYGIFGLVGLMQSALVLLGDLLFLHIQCSNPVAFFLFGIFIGQMFCLIVFTITELFGDVGKALCVILLIMQVAASGGTFPVEMLDPLLGNVVEFLPFYHAMRLLQECVAGIDPVWSLVSAAALVVMMGGILVVGLPLRRPFRKLNDFFEEQLEKTGYM